MRTKKLTERRRQILRHIAQATAERGYPPTVREIGEAVGLSSSSSVHFHLRALAEMGHLHRDGSLTRALRLSDDGAEGEVGLGPARLQHRKPAPDAKWVPIVGEVAAGRPIFAEEHYEDLVPLPERFVPNGEAFMLRVEGDSMVEAGIHDGDYVIVARTSTADDGDIVVALLDDEATVKTFFRRGDGFELRPANRSMHPILVDEVHVLGKVRGLMRNLR
jgi:repressor LexA